MLIKNFKKMMRLLRYLIFIEIILYNSAFARVPYTPAEYLKNYALATCFGNGFSNSKNVVQEASAAASGYLELGDMPLDAYNEVYFAGKKFLAKKYMSYTGTAQLTIMKCIDFYHSKKLETIINKYSKQEKNNIK